MENATELSWPLRLATGVSRVLRLREAQEIGGFAMQDFGDGRISPSSEWIAIKLLTLIDQFVGLVERSTSQFNPL